jgi:transcriptional regulator with XRE-family HTH domain
MIREQRVMAKLSLAKLATRVGVSVSTMSKIETGKISTSFERLETVADALQIDLAQLLGSTQLNAGAPQRTHQYGTRRSVTSRDQAVMVDAGQYSEWFHAPDMLNKHFQPMVVDVRLGKIEDYGPLTSHNGEEWNYVLEGELEFHTDVYSPVRLKAGDSIYFDAEMKHAHVRVGRGPCRMIAVIAARPAKPGEPGMSFDLRVVRRSAAK